MADPSGYAWVCLLHMSKAFSCVRCSCACRDVANSVARCLCDVGKNLVASIVFIWLSLCIGFLTCCSYDLLRFSRYTCGIHGIHGIHGSTFAFSRSFSWWASAAIAHAVAWVVVVVGWLSYFFNYSENISQGRGLARVSFRPKVFRPKIMC